MKKYVRQAAFGVTLTGLVAAALLLPNDVGRPQQTAKVSVAQTQTAKEKMGITLHYRWEGTDTPHVYYENVDGNGEVCISYPGIPMKETQDGWYSYTIADAKSADIIFSISDCYETATLNRTAGEWWLDQDTWYAENPDGASENTKKTTTQKQEQAETLLASQKDAGYHKEDVTTVSKDGTVKVGYSQIDTVEQYIDTYVETQDLAAAEDASITIHYYAADGEVPSIYYWNGLPVDQETVWPGQPMTFESENWYQYTFTGTEKINFLFTYGLTQTKDLTRKSGEWWYKNGKWTSKKPNSYTETEKPIEGKKNDFREESIYFLITTRFYDGDEDNNVHCWDENVNQEASDPDWRGDFKGLIEKMDYIKALGFSAIWITPVVENCSGLDYHGYHAINFQKVDPRYESDGVTYQTVINEAHKRGMKIIQDVVFNHTGNFGEENIAPLFTKNGDVEGGYETINCLEKIEDSGLPDNYDELAPGGQYQSRLGLLKDHCDPVKPGVRNDKKTFYHRYDSSFSWDYYTVQLGQIAGDCVDLNTENPIVAKYLTDSYSKYINMGVDGFRVDTVKHISRLTLNNFFFPVLQSVGGEDFYMFGEVCTKSSQVWYRGQTPALSAPFYTWKESKEYPWRYYDETVEAEYDAYAATAPEKIYSDFPSEMAYYNWRMENETELGLAHTTNMNSALENYSDNANDVDGQSVDKEISAQAAQPVSTNAFLDGNTYHAPDYSQSNGFNVIDFTMHWNFINAEKAFGAAIHGYDYDNDKVTDVNSGGDYAYNDSTWNVTYVDSHDYGPDGQMNDRYGEGEEAWAENMCLLFTFRGIPCIYYGSEVEFQAGKKIDTGGTSPISETGRAYFGDYLEGDVTASDFGVYSAEAGSKVEETLAAPLSQQLIRLNTIRRAIPALQKGQYTISDITYSKIAFKRRYTDTNTDSFALVTITGDATFNNIPNGTYVDAITGDEQQVSNGTLSVSAPGKGNMRVYVLDTELSPAPGKVGSDTTYLK